MFKTLATTCFLALMPLAAQTEIRSPVSPSGPLAARAPNPHQLPNPDTRMLRVYVMCMEFARVQIMDQRHVTLCAASYQAIKLGFVPDMSVDRFQRLDVKSRAAVNQRGYLAWLAWSAAHSDQIAALRRVARARILAAPA
ncbi:MULTISPECIES: hypothetical protein [unclassified Marinovum]